MLNIWKEIRTDTRPKVRYWIPDAAVDEEDLKLEMKQLKERGFGGVEIVTLATVPEEIMTGEDGWGTERWNHIAEVIGQTAEELGMTVDFANGPMWPISMPTVKDADDPAAICELTYGVTEVGADGSYKGRLPERRVKHEEGTPVLVHVLAYQQNEEGKLIEKSYKDLREHMSSCGSEEIVECDLGMPEENCKWLIFAFWRQPSVHKTGKDQYYVINHINREGVEACEKYWAPILKNEKISASVESIFCDSMEYATVMEWSPDFPEEFEKRRGYSILPYLPFVGSRESYPVGDAPGYSLEDEGRSEMINNDYFETLTQCYCEYHLAGLEKMAEKYGKTIRYQVAYNKPFEGERSALYVAVPENEALGRPSLDYQKVMAAAAHLGRKERYSFECAAEFGNSYGQTYEDLFWWVKRSLMAGMNAQVLHGASYSGKYEGRYSVNGQMRGVQWPGYEGFGKIVSNYWNRTLSVEDARGCMDTIARLNTIFRKKAKVDCAVYRECYSNGGWGSEYCLYNDGGALSDAGFSYEFVSPHLLNLPVCTVKDGCLDPEGPGYKCLIIPQTASVSFEFLNKVKQLLEAGLLVVWEGEKPERSIFFKEWKDDAARDGWLRLRDEVWEQKKLLHVRKKLEIPELLKSEGILPELLISAADNESRRGHYITAVHEDEKNGITYYAVYQHNCVDFTPDTPNEEELACSALYRKGTTKGAYVRPGRKSFSKLTLSLERPGTVYLCDPWSGHTERLDFHFENRRNCGSIDLQEDEMILLAVIPEKQDDEIILPVETGEIPIELNTLRLEAFEPESGEETSFLRSGFGKGTEYTLGHLVPWRELAPELETFAGRGIYTGTVNIDSVKEGERFWICIGDVSDTFHVSVNGKQSRFPDQVLKKVEVTELIREGENTIEIEVTSNLYNRLLKNASFDGEPFSAGYFSKNYGIWEKDGKICSLVYRK